MESEAEVILQNAHYDSDADSVTNELDESEDKLINSYEEALSLTNIDIAKLIARSTCKNEQSSSVGYRKYNFGKSFSDLIQTLKKKKVNMANQGQNGKKSKSKKKKKWEVGSHCRAIYSEDQLEYEAIVSKVVNGNERLVTFIGYNNTQVVEISALKPSLGVESQAQQILEADGIGVEYPGDDKDDEENELNDIPKKKPRPKPPKKKKHKKCGLDHEMNEPSIPFVPFMPQMPGLSSKLRLPYMPLMPPPLQSDTDEHLYSMLMSWYMSGYYTGLYQGIKRKSSTSNRKR